MLPNTYIKKKHEYPIKALTYSQLRNYLATCEVIIPAVPGSTSYAIIITAPALGEIWQSQNASAFRHSTTWLFRATSLPRLWFFG